MGQSSFCGQLGLLQGLIVVCTVSRTCSSLQYLTVQSLTLVVYVRVVVWGCVLYVCEPLNFEGGTMMVMVP